MRSPEPPGCFGMPQHSTGPAAGWEVEGEEEREGDGEVEGQGRSHLRESDRDAAEL